MKKTDGELDFELSELLDEVNEDVKAIYDYSTVTINGKYIPNSKLAIRTAQKLLRVSELLEYFED